MDDVFTSPEHKVLIVEDDESISTFLRSSLELKGVSSAVAATGAEAVATASSGDFSLMTIDYFLPDMTGEEVVVHLRERGFDIPFVMITGMGDEKIAVRSMKLGAVDYLVKSDNLFDRVPKVVTEILDRIRTDEQLRNARAALRDSEERFSSIFHNSNDGIILLDERLSLVDANRKALLFLGYDSIKNMADLGVDGMFSPEIKASLENLLNRDVADPVFRFEGELKRKDGEMFLADIVSSTFPVGRQRRIAINFRDLSDRVRHLDAVKKAADEWSVTFNSINDLISVHDREMRIVKVNKAFVDFVGRPHADILGKKCFELLHPAGSDMANCPHRRTVAEGIVVTEEMYHPERGIPLLVTTSPIKDTSGEITGTVHVAKDISDIKSIRADLRESEHFLGNILDSIQDGITILDTEFRIIKTNRYMERKYAVRMPLLGKNCFDVFQNRQEPCEVCPTRRTFETGESASEILAFKTPGQKVCGWMEVFTFPLLDSDSGELKGVVEFMRDISERLRMESSLKESEEKYRRLFNEALDAIIVAECETHKIMDCNRAAEELFSCDRDWLIGVDLHAIFPSAGEYDELHAALNRQFDEGSRADELIQAQVVGQGGSFRDVSIKADTVQYQNGRFLNLVLRDITERKKIGERIKQAQKLESIGTLAGGIAHDFNNILTAVIGFAEIIKTDVLAGQQTELDDVESIIEAANRAGDLVRQVLTFSRESEMDRRNINIAPVVKETVKFLKASLPSTIQIRENLNTHIRSIFADPVQMHQVLMNLCTNAHHAMRKKGGTLTISLDETILPEPSLEGDRKIPAGEFVRLTVADTGHGMDELTLARIFDPYFTTKGREEGTGLGLSVVHGIIESHGGTISVESRLEEGTTFRIYLPLIKEGATRDESEVVADSIPRGTERILLVDDEINIVKTGERMLSRLGYEVTSYTDSVQCLERFRSAPERFDLVLTDLTMPQITGLDLAREVKSLSPRTPVIMMTGFAETLNEDNISDYHIDILVKKPVLKKEIAEAIRSVLDRSA